MPAQPMRVPFVCKPPSLRCGLDRPFCADCNGSWSPRLSGDRDRLLTLLLFYDFFFHQTSDEENSRLKKTELVTQIAKCFSHSKFHIRDRDVGSEDGY